MNEQEAWTLEQGIRPDDPLGQFVSVKKNGKTIFIFSYDFDEDYSNPIQWSEMERMD